MPFRSQAQRRYFHWAVGQGKISPKTVKEWERHTPEGKLPERVGKDKKAMRKQASDVMMEAFFDELEKIGAVEKDAIFGALARGAGRAMTGLRSGLGKALTGAGARVMPKAPAVAGVAKAMPAAAKPATGWALGPAQRHMTGSSWSKIMQAPARPAGAGSIGGGVAHRAVEQTPQILASKQKLVQSLQAKGMAVPKELQAELSIPVSRGLASPAIAQGAGAGGTVSQRIRPRFGATGTAITG